jgi:hypothetical protein
LSTRHCCSICSLRVPYTDISSLASKSQAKSSAYIPTSEDGGFTPYAGNYGIMEFYLIENKQCTAGAMPDIYLGNWPPCDCTG